MVTTQIGLALTAKEWRERIALLRFFADACERDNIALYRERPDDEDGSRAIANLRAFADSLESIVRRTE